MKTFCYTFAGFWFLVILACGSPHRAAVRGETSSATSQTLLERCSNPIRNMQCQGNMVYSTICLRNIANEYFALQSLAERKAHLLSYGCPEPIVNSF